MKICQDIYMVGSGSIGLSEAHDCHIYLIDGGSELALVDTGLGLDVDRIVANIRSEGFDEKRISQILLSHCHVDHAGGCKELKALTGAKIVCTELEGRLLESGAVEELGLDRAKRSGLFPQDYAFDHVKPDRIVEDGETLMVGRYEVRTIIVSGHSLATACYLLDMDGYKTLFSSDVVFHGGTIGIGNWPGSTLAGYRESIGKLSNLGVDALLPGHMLWTLVGGQEHLDTAIANVASAWVPPAWQCQHEHI